MNYSFPIAFLFNTSSITFLLIVLGLSGQSEMAAEIAVIQASTLALFFSFSANARSVILNANSTLGSQDLHKVRMLLVIPLSIIAFYLVDFVIEINIFLVFFIIVRRALDWIVEINLSEMERVGDQSHARQYIIVQLVMLLVALVWVFIGTQYPLVGIFAWCLSPMLMLNKLQLRGNSKRTSLSELRDLLLPHFGSTAVIGIGVYIFRILIVLLVGKAIAGDLFTAFSIGGVIGSVFASSFGPSIALREQKGEGIGLPRFIKAIISINVFLGIGLSLLAKYDINILSIIDKSQEFTFAVGLSMIGGAAMVAAQTTRLRVIQLGKDGNVFGADVLMNIILIAVIPYAHYLLGTESLGALYLLSATLAYIFYRASSDGIENVVGEGGVLITRVLIAFMLIFPIFFMLDGSIFSSTSYNYDSHGLIEMLPIPVSVLACFIGIMLLGRYRLAHTSLAVIFIMFVLMTISAVLSSPDMSINTQGKFILLMQFILPYFALVLGQTFENRGERQVIEKSFLISLLMIIPTQVILTVFHPVPILTPFLGFFSIYQHIQYVPVIFVSAYLLVIFSLYKTRYYSLPLLFLTVFMGVYVGAASSKLAIALLIVGIGLFALYSWKEIKQKWLVTIVGLIAIVSPFTYIYMNGDTGYYTEKFNISYIPSEQIPENKIISKNFKSTDRGGAIDIDEVNDAIDNIMPKSRDRREYWGFYLNKITESYSAFLFGHSGRINRYEFPSAHNYYLDFIYHFGVIAILPLFYLIILTVKMMIQNMKHVSSHSIFGIAFVVVFMIAGDSLFKVGFRQPYPGIFMFFIWGVLLSRLYMIKSKS